MAAPTGPANEAHDLVMSVFGEMSKGERDRVEIQLLPHLDNWLSRKFDPSPSTQPSVNSKKPPSPTGRPKMRKKRSARSPTATPSSAGTAPPSEQAPAPSAPAPAAAGAPAGRRGPYTNSGHGTLAGRGGGVPAVFMRDRVVRNLNGKRDLAAGCWLKGT